MIQITVEGRRASVSNKELLTSGSAGIEAQFTLDEAWELVPARTAVFRVGDDGSKYDVPLDNTLTCVVPPECLTVSDEVLFIGIYGGNGSGTIIIPTIWVSAGVIKPGTEPNTPREYQPTPSVVEQIHIIANRAEQTATDAMTLVEEGLTDLSTLESTVQGNEEQRQQNETQREADFNTMMQSARAYVLEPSVSAIVYDPNAESGEKISPDYLSINAYYIDNEGDRGGFAAPNFEVSIIPESGTPTTAFWRNTTGVSLELPQTITPGTTVQARIWKDNSLGLPMTLAEITIPVISDGLNGYSGTDGIVYTLEPSVNAIVYDPNAALGERISPTSLTVNMYEKRGTASRIAKLVSKLTIEINGIAYFDTGVSSFTKELGNLTPNSTVRAFATNDGKTLATITIPIVSHGKQGLQGDPGVSPEVTVTQISGGHTVEIEDADGVKTFDVLDGASDAGRVTYDETATYQAGSVGAELSDLTRQLSDVEEAIRDVDSELSDTSEKPVQNKTLYNELNILTPSPEVTYVNDGRSTANMYNLGIAEIAFPTSDPIIVKEVDVYAATGAVVMLAVWSFRRFTEDISSVNYHRGYFKLEQILDEVTAVDNHAVFNVGNLSYDPTSTEQVLIASCATSKIGLITNVSNDLMPLSDSNNRNFNTTEVGEENPYLFRFRKPDQSYSSQPAYSVIYQDNSSTATPIKSVVVSLDNDMTAIRTATESDIGKALKVKTVTDGKVVEWEFGDTGSQITVDSSLSDASENPVQNKVLYDELIDKNTYTVNDTETIFLSAGKHNVDGMNQYFCGSCDAPTYGEYSVSRIELAVGTNGETIVFGLWQFRAIQSYPTYKRGYWSLVSVLGSVVSADYKAVFEPSTPVIVNGENQRIIATCTNKVISYRRSNFTPNPYKKARVATALARYQNNDFSNIAVGEESSLLVNFCNYAGWEYADNDPNVVAYEITYTPTVTETITEQKTAMEKIEADSVSGVLDGKIWYCAGDSVTAGIDDVLSYADVIAARNNMTLWKDGIGGSTMTDAGDSKKQNAFSFQRYLNIPANADFVTIWFGINDKTMNYTIGAIDSDDDSTFYGAYNKVLTWIINNRPLARVGLVVTHKTSTEIETAIRNLAKKYGFLAFDIPSSPDIPFWHPVSSYYASDVSTDIKTLRQTQWWRESGNPSHPTADGYKAISYALEKWIMGL